MNTVILDRYKALLFDLNGTMVDDMWYHITAWHRLLNELGMNISLNATKPECYGKNHEILERLFPGRFTMEEKDRISIEKERQYQKEFRPHLKLIDGLEAFLQQARSKGTKMAIGSAAIRFNIDFVIDGLDIRHYFDAIVSADDVKKSKPDPETWLNCAEQLLVAPADCVVFEDAPKGVESAANAGMDAVVITTMHTKDEFSGYKNVVHYIDNYKEEVNFLSKVV